MAFEIAIPRTGRDAVAADLLDLRQRLRVDLAVVNAENASHGFGLPPDMARILFVIGLERHYYRARERSRRNPERQPRMSEARDPPRGHLQPFPQAVLHGLHPGS